MLHSIAVTTDFSEPSRDSLNAAAALAKKFRARLELVHVAENPDGSGIARPPPHSRPRENESQDNLESRLKDFACQSAALAGLEAQTRVLHGNVDEVLRRFQVSEGIDLLVIASHGHGDVKSFLLGSFATKAIRSVTCPVLVFRQPRSNGAPGGRASGDGHTFHPRRILVPHDFSVTSAAALETARSWARAFDASVRILFVDSPLAGFGNASSSRSITRLREIVQRDWEGIPAEPVVSQGNPADEILKESIALNADLICLASHGLTAADNRPLGGVAERVIHAATCPVLVVKRRPRSAMET